MRQRKILEPRDDRGHAARAGVVQGAAPERSEARAENHPCIEQVRILDDALAQARNRLVEVLENEPVDEVVRRTPGRRAA